MAVYTDKEGPNRKKLKVKNCKNNKKWYGVKYRPEYSKHVLLLFIYIAADLRT